MYLWQQKHNINTFLCAHFLFLYHVGVKCRVYAICDICSYYIQTHKALRSFAFPIFCLGSTLVHLCAVVVHRCVVRVWISILYDDITRGSSSAAAAKKLSNTHLISASLVCPNHLSFRGKFIRHLVRLWRFTHITREPPTTNVYMRKPVLCLWAL